MALFTDSGLINISDLEVYESTLSKVASTHNINIESKTAIILAAIGDRLLMRLVHAGGANSSGFYSGLTSTRTIAALPPQSRWLFDLDNVVVTDTLKRWICYEILAQVFSEAYNVQMNDRFKQKWADYAVRAQETENSLYTLGIPVVYRPLAQPALAQVTTGAGTLTAGIITVQTTWVDVFGNEGAPSLLVPVTLAAASSVSVTVTHAQNNPPNAAAGWNVYVGSNGNTPARQNSNTLPLNMPWTAPVSGFVQGVAPTNGQQPDCFALDLPRTLRG